MGDEMADKSPEHSPGDGAQAGRFTLRGVVSPPGFEPGTQGLKVPRSATGVPQLDAPEGIRTGSPEHETGRRMGLRSRCA